MELETKGPFFAVLRHSVRMDMVDHGTDQPWEDRQERPWDPPITDYTLPRTIFQNAKMDKMGMVAVYSSPFRRCLQTAAVVAQHLDIGQVIVHPGLGEVMARARKCCQTSAATNNAEKYLLSHEACARTVELASGGKVATSRPIFEESTIPPWSETYLESVERMEAAISYLTSKHKTFGQSVVVVTHGDALQAAANVFLDSAVSLYDLDFCALLVFDSKQNICYKSGLQLINV